MNLVNPLVICTLVVEALGLVLLVLNRERGVLAEAVLVVGQELILALLVQTQALTVKKTLAVVVVETIYFRFPVVFLMIICPPVTEVPASSLSASTRRRQHEIRNRN